MTRQQVELLDQNTKAKRLDSLGRMKNFYNMKITTATEKQAYMFGLFIAALDYSTDIISKYDDLTKGLDNEDRASSKS